MSYAEDLFEESLRLVLADPEQYIRNYRPDWLRNTTGRNLEYDFYIPGFKMAFEIQGQHHYDDMEQQKRDDLKKILSEKQGVALFLVSIFQIGPEIIRRKIINFSFSKNFIPRLKPYDREKYTEIRERVKGYKSNSLLTYGESDCQKSPQSMEFRKIRRIVRKFLKKNNTFNIDLDGKVLRCRYRRATKSKIFIEIPGIYGEYSVRYRKFFETVRELRARNGFDGREESTIARGGLTVRLDNHP